MSVIANYEFIAGTQNSIPDFLTREFLQDPKQDVRKEAHTTTRTP